MKRWRRMRAGLKNMPGGQYEQANGGGRHRFLLPFVICRCVCRTKRPMYGRNLQHTFTNRDLPINPTTISSLTPAWDFSSEDVVTASPTVVDGIVYAGAWNGYFYALDASSGALIWKFALDCESAIVPIPPRCPQPANASPRFLSDGA
jgi:hypothetical protein